MITNIDEHVKKCEQCALLVEIKNSVEIVEDVLTVSQKVKHRFII